MIFASFCRRNLRLPPKYLQRTGNVFPITNYFFLFIQISHLDGSQLDRFDVGYLLNFITEKFNIKRKDKH
jgi:hypothetical protein